MVRGRTLTSPKIQWHSLRTPNAQCIENTLNSLARSEQCSNLLGQPSLQNYLATMVANHPLQNIHMYIYAYIYIYVL